MRIGIDARFLGFNASGLARYSESLLEALSRVDEKNEYIVFVHAGLTRRLRLGENFQLSPLRGHPLGLQSMRRLARAIRRESLDVFHALFPLAPFWSDTPTLLTVHDTAPFRRESGIFTWRMPFAPLIYSYGIYPLSLRKCKWAVCVSRATRDAAAGFFPDLFNKSIVVHSGVGENFRVPQESATLDLIRRRLELPERYVLYSGSARPDKNIGGVLRVFADLIERFPRQAGLQLALEVTGEAALIEALQKSIRQYGLAGRVRILRDMKDEERRVIFADARALLLLGRSEGFGFPVIEAQLAGVPVVAADFAALPEIAGEHGAVLVNPDVEPECATMLERVLTSDELRAYLVENGRRNAQRFSWNSTAERLLDIYELLFYPRDRIDFPSRSKISTRILEWLPF